MVAHSNVPWKLLKNKKILITGARGMIGSFLIDVLMLRNQLHSDNISIYAVGRNEQKAKERFQKYLDSGNLKILVHDISKELPAELGGVDYVIHGASNTHPRAYSGDPIGTITTNIIGTYNLLEYAIQNDVKRFMLLSTVEVYGENRGDVEKFDESYCGYIDCNTLRAGYPESKRASEALCNAYAHAHGIEILLPRLSRVYGPTMLKEDSKAIAQFIANGVAGEDVVLKSKGDQLFSYCYVADAVSALLNVLLLGETGNAYNIAGLNSDVTLRRLAQVIADIGGSQVIFDLPDEVEAAGYSKATKALLDTRKVEALDWKPAFSIEEGLNRTIEIIRKTS